MHQIINTGSEPLRYLALSNQSGTEICEYPDSNKLGVYVAASDTPELRKMFHGEATVDYYDREPTVSPSTDAPRSSGATTAGRQTRVWRPAVVMEHVMTQRKQRTVDKRRATPLSLTHPNAAGIDIGSASRTQSRAVQHMQKALVQMNIQLATVIADVAGASGQAILRAIVDGERDGHRLAALCDVRIKASADDVAASLQGHWRAEHLFALKQTLAAFDFCGTQLAECDAEIEAQFKPPKPNRPRARSARRRATRRSSICVRACSRCAASI